VSRGANFGVRDLLDVGLIGIRTRRLRAALSAVGIAIAIATVVVVTSIPASSQAALLERLSALGTNLLRVDAIPGEAGEGSLPERAAALVDRVGPVTGTAAVANIHQPVRRNDLLPENNGSGVTALATTLDLLPVVNGAVAAGSFLDASTVGLPYVVLGSVAAQRLGIIPDMVPFAPTVMIGDRPFTVRGLLAPSELSPDLERSALVDWTAASHLLGFDGRPTVLYLTADETQISAVGSVVTQTLTPQTIGTVQVGRPSDALAAREASAETFSGLFLGLAGVALLVGGVGVANTMIVSVLERRREIGLRRALGAHRGQIRAQFLTEAIALSILGGAAGTVAGAAGATVWSLVHGWPVVIPLVTILGSVGATLAVGALAGIYPAIRASRLTPTEALAAT
jgi:putative ABC transport system permease protein